MTGPRPMTGHEHYLQAERLLDALDETVQSSDAMALCVAQAQVHATLAVAYATANTTRTDAPLPAGGWKP